MLLCLGKKLLPNYLSGLKQFFCDAELLCWSKTAGKGSIAGKKIGQKVYNILDKL